MSVGLLVVVERRFSPVYDAYFTFETFFVRLLRLGPARLGVFFPFLFRENVIVVRNPAG